MIANNYKSSNEVKSNRIDGDIDKSTLMLEDFTACPLIHTRIDGKLLRMWKIETFLHANKYGSPYH